MDAPRGTLPAEVREMDATKTSVYRQGELIYDGATGQAVGSAAARGGAGAMPEGNSLNEMLKWGIQNSDPAELARRAELGTRAAPSVLDKEILDMMLGQPIVAKMRECLAKVEPEALAGLGGVDAGVGALEELEYYAEDIDNALDMAKIGGIQALVRIAAPPESSSAPTDELGRAKAELADELREGACGCLAAAMQNNPKVQAAALVAAVPHAMMLLLRATGATAAGSGAGAGAAVGEVGLPVRRKALLALSALLRGWEDEAALSELLPLVLPTLSPYVEPGADAKMRKRALFLLAALAGMDGPVAIGVVVRNVCRAGSSLPSALLGSVGDADEDNAVHGVRVLAAVRAAAETKLASAADASVVAAALRAALRAAGGAATCAAALGACTARDQAGEGNEERTRLTRELGSWLGA